MKILTNIQKVPGGLMIVPMMITAVLNTFLPEFLYMGDPTTALFSTKGTMTIIGLILFVTGTQLKLNEIPMTIKRGGVLSIVKLLIGYASAIFVLNTFGLDGFLGISAVAFVAVMVSTNPGIYIALANNYGDRVDKAAFGLFNVVSVPAIPILIFGAASGGRIDYMTVVATLTPFAMGIVLGNLDSKIRELMAPGTPIILPFLGFCFGSAVNLNSALQAGGSGLLLTAIFLIVNIPLFLATDRFILKRPGYAGSAFCSVAGISVVVPSMLATSQPEYAPYVEAATAQIAMVMVITSFTVPFLTKIVVNKFGDGKEKVDSGLESSKS